MNLGSLDLSRLDAVFQASLALAAEADDPQDRELGRIHLLKYAYLADLAHAELNEGRTFTGVDWTFHNFGPWSVGANAEIDRAADEIEAVRISATTKFGDRTRFRVNDPTLVDRFRRELPPVVIGSLARCVREFGNSTHALLNHVYLTGPILAAAPGDRLEFSGVPQRATESIAAEPSSPPPLSVKQRKLHRAKVDGIRAGIKERLGQRREGLVAMPPPRYDDVFEAGAAWIESLGGGPSPAGTFDVTVSDEHWKSGARARDVG